MGQNSSMLINIIITSIIKSIVYLSFWYRYQYQLYDSDTVWYFNMVYSPSQNMLTVGVSGNMNATTQ